MQKKRATQLKAEWGDKPCEHAQISKEYDLGKPTGAYVCNSCGKSISVAEKRALRNKNS
ncbi:MAG: hypothetical protein ABIS27_10960 [Longimicrobiales bacterium]